MPQPVFADSDLIEHVAQIFNAARATTAAFECVAVVFRATDDANDVGAHFERFENMFRLKATCTGNQ